MEDKARIENQIVPVTAAVILRDDKILIARRKQGKKRAGFWEFPGGKIRNGESPEECLRREIFEELNIHISVKAFLGSFIYSYPDVTIDLQAYLCTYRGGNIVFRDHDSVIWVSPDDLRQFRFSPADVPIVEKVLARLGKDGEDSHAKQDT